MKQTIENITKAAQCANLLVSDLRQANTGAETVQLGDTLLDLIGDACALEKKLKRLLYAVLEDARHAGQLGDDKPDLVWQRDRLKNALQLCSDFIRRAHGGEGMTEDERWLILSDADREARAVLAETEAA